ncbi:MAG: dihydroorotate dehydrogenase electron transfer subunit [Candidatus Omnitrophota bacterium]
MKKKQNKAEILANVKIKGRYYKITFTSGVIAQSALPGQFVMLKVGEIADVFLRRPLSVHRVSGRNLDFFYEVVGKGTEILSRRPAGESVDLLGPLGNGFDYSAERIVNRQPVLVAGGMGIAPLFFLAEKLADSKKLSVCAAGASLPGRQAGASGGKRYPLVLIGARTKDQIFCEKQFKKIGCDVKIATDDGSAGFPGRVTSLLDKLLLTMNYQLLTIYGCGPKPMLKEIARLSRQKRIPCQLSLEAHMACGIGACLGCAVNTQNGYKRVCQEGPVFDADELLW